MAVSQFSIPFARYIALAVFSGVFATLAVAQETQNEESATAEETAAALTAQDVQARLTTVTENADLDEATRNAAATFLQQALDQLQSANSWSQQAAEFQASRDTAPSDLESNQEALSATYGREPEGVADDLSTADLEIELASLEAELSSKRSELEELRAEVRRRAERRRQIPELIGEARKRLEEARTQLETPPDANEAPALTDARRILARARVQSAEQELRALEQELASYDARSRVITLRQDLATRRISQLEDQVDRWKTLVGRRRQQEAREAERRARELVLRATSATPELRAEAEKLANENIQLAEMRTGPNGVLQRIRQASETEERIRKLNELASRHLQQASERIERGGLNNATGNLLRRYLAELPSVREHQRAIAARQELMADTELELLDLREQREQVINVSEEVRARLGSGLDQLDEEQREEIRGLMRELYFTKRDLLDDLIIDYERYFDTLTRLDAEEEALIAVMDSLKNLINEHVLWIRSMHPVGATDVAAFRSIPDNVPGPEALRATATALLWELRRNLASYLALALVLLVYLGVRKRTHAWYSAANERASKLTCTLFRPSLETMGYVLLVSAVFPALIAFVGWRLYSSPQSTDLAHAIGAGLLAVAALLYLMGVGRRVLWSDGIADNHFDWPAGASAKLRQQLKWFGPVILPIAFFGSALYSYSPEAWCQSLARVIFILMSIAIAIFADRILRPGKGPLHAIARAQYPARGHKYVTMVYAAGVAVPLILSVLSALGYHYTAVQLAWRFLGTVTLLLGLVLFHELVRRWWRVTRRRLAIEQAQKRRAAQRAKEEDDSAYDATEDVAYLDLSLIDDQTQRLIRSAVTLTLVVGIWLLWAGFLPALSVLDEWQVWEVAGTQTLEVPDGAPEGTEPQTINVPEPITVRQVFLAGIIGIVAMVMMRNLPGLLEILVLERMNTPPGERYAINTIVRYIIVIIGVTWALSELGLSWSKLQWLVAAVGLGLGFGLQEIFANFVSGVILLFERPVRVGDIVTVGETSGRVTDMRMRATSIVDWNRKELIVPNKEFITGRLINWTLSDPTLRIVVPVGIAYNSNVEEALRIILEIAKNDPNVLDDPEPAVWFLGFGDNALQLELFVFSPSPDLFLVIKHDMHMAIEKALREAGIEIAFPQRDIHVRSIQAALPILEDKEGRGDGNGQSSSKAPGESTSEVSDDQPRA